MLMPVAKSDLQARSTRASHNSNFADQGAARQIGRYARTGGLAEIVDIGLFHAFVMAGERRTSRCGLKLPRHRHFASDGEPRDRQRCYFASQASAAP